jgi:hypothetical protein
MNDPIWKLMPRMLGQTVDVVWRKWPDGREESCLVTTPEYLKWLEEGNVPEPAEE